MTKLIRGIVTSFTRAAGKVPRFACTGRVGETMEDREVIAGQYGFYSKPHTGSECVVLKEGGVLIMVAGVDRRYEMSLEDGEIAIKTDEGDKVHLKRGNEILVKSSGKVVIDCDSVEIGGASELKKLVTEDVITALASHTHLGVTTGDDATLAPPPGTFTALAHATSNTKAK